MKKLTILSILISPFFYGQNDKVGIGTDEPTATLHVKTKDDVEYIMRLEDSQDTRYGDYVVTSSDNLGTFKKTQTNAFKTTFVVSLPTTGTNITTAAPGWQTTGLTFEIPNGRWTIVTNLLLKCQQDVSSRNNNAVLVKATLADEGTLVPSGDIEGNTPGSKTGTGIYQGVLNTPLNKSLLTGSIIINNTGTKKNYTLIANRTYLGDSGLNCTISNLGIRSETQNIIYAIPLNQ